MADTSQAREAEWLARNKPVALDGREEGFVQNGCLVSGRTVVPCLRHLRQQAGLE